MHCVDCISRLKLKANVNGSTKIKRKKLQGEKEKISGIWGMDGLVVQSVFTMLVALNLISFTIKAN